jgi:AcrR family transcriptional regulator
MRTKAAIVDACLALVDAGDLRPTAPRVAEKAGVSVRSVFQHFADLDSLFAAVGDEAVSRLRNRGLHLNPEEPVAERIVTAVKHRTALLEELTPLRRSIAVNAWNSKIVNERLHWGHSLFRDELAAGFAEELRGDTQLLDSLDTVMSWPTWDHMRTLLGLDEETARGVLVRVLRSLLRVPDE